MGTGYVEDLAHTLGGAYVAGAADVGIVASLEELAEARLRSRRRRPAGPGVLQGTQPASASTSSQSWRPWVRPGCLLYRTLVAAPLGQASIPMNQQEALQGVRNRIGTISLDGDDTVAVAGLDPSPDDDEPIYVGIYTTGTAAAAMSASGSRSRRPASRPRWCRGPGPAAAWC